MLKTLIFFGGLTCLSVNSQGLAIDFIKERADNSTYAVNDVIADKTSKERLHILCRTDTCLGNMPEHNDYGKLVALITGVVVCTILVAALVTVLIRKRWNTLSNEQTNLRDNDTT
ncbi:uncharacterized protein LOC127836410 isoform X2 [Dreissena polymorpha]|uniref:uncharacterized protein LOC127836006 n=1 Tax=Dreissena polymorpha TaxID=45954 RepID=UPI002264D320|nr:uncharacterized protein LOC127836006 [Dreissena polymorpha]XP_052218995.1 uncharacterized protein LOC127836410 isoform X2 [Dreissena polymorpha]